MVVYMQPEVQLGEVRVVGQTKKQELNDIMGDYRKKGTFYNGNPPVLSFVGIANNGPMNYLVKPRVGPNALPPLVNANWKQQRVDRRYNPPFIMRATGLT
jgi:hypothetical protein